MNLLIDLAWLAGVMGLGVAGILFLAGKKERPGQEKTVEIPQAIKEGPVHIIQRA